MCIICIESEYDVKIKLLFCSLRVTTDKGNQYLIHKGPDYGESSDTVVVDARHMSSNWKSVKSRDTDGTKNVGSYVQAGGKDYKWIKDNCIIAAERMYKG